MNEDVAYARNTESGCKISWVWKFFCVIVWLDTPKRYQESSWVPNFLNL